MSSASPPATTTPESPVPLRAGMRGPLATVGLVALGVVLLLLALLPWWLSDPARVTAWVRRNVPNLNGTVEMRRATFTWAGPIVFDDVVVVPRDGRREPVVVRRIEAEHGIFRFLLSGGDCGRVRVEGLETHLVFDERRESNVTGLFYDPSRPPKPPGPPPKSGLRMRLEVDDARARIEGPWSDDPWTSEPVDLRLSLAPVADGSGNAWTLEPARILADARLEPSIANGVLAYVVPILADTTSTSGRFSLDLDGGTFPVGMPEKATFSGRLTMHAVDLGPGPLVTRLLERVLGDAGLATTIRVADDSRIAFRMENRRVWHEGLEIGVPLPRGRRLDLASRGWVGLDDQSLDLEIALPIPDDMPLDRPVLAALGGKRLSIGIGGKLGEPRPEFDGSLRGVAADVIVGVVDRLLRRRAGGDPATPAGPAPTTGEDPADIAPPRGPRPNWRPPDDGPRSEPNTTAAASPPPPPRPGWAPGQRPGAGERPSAALASGGDTPAPLATNEGAKPLGGAKDKPLGGATVKPLGGAKDKPLADSGAPAAGDGSPERAGSAQIIDELRDRIAPQTANDPRADQVIDLVGGLIDSLARRRAERAAAERAAAEAGGSADAAPGRPAPAAEPPLLPRRGRLLRRLLPPPPAGAPAPAASAPAAPQAPAPAASNP